MKQITVEEKLEKVYFKYEKRMKSEGMAFLVEDETGEFSWQRETGNLKNNHKFTIASVTKLYATTVILNLVDEGKIALEDKIAKYLPHKVLEGLHVYKGKEYSFELTLRQLLSQTSGLPDYFSVALKGGASIEEQFDSDPELSFEECLSINKRLKTRFAPDTKGKAYYSDMNFDLLQPIIESITNMTVEENYNKYIYKPLQLKDTYLFTKGMSYDFPGFWMKNKIHKIPNLLSGWPMSGSMISTKMEMIIFLKAFWGGKLFEQSHYDEMKEHNYIQYFPMQYGLGHMRFAAFGAPEIIGHSGSTGVLCYYVPKYKVYITGCINEVNEAKATRMVLRLANCFK